MRIRIHWFKSIALLGLFVGCLFISKADAQRHPESAGASSYYRPDADRTPAWRKRPQPFLRGPMDRTERGQNRLFLNADDGVGYLNYANEKYQLYYRETIPWLILAGRPFFMRNVQWDRMGNYMGGGFQRVFAFEETRGDIDGVGSSFIDHKGWGWRIGHFAYKKWNWTSTVGDDVRTTFTPLTLIQSHLPTARIDIDRNSKDELTLIYTRGGTGKFSTWGRNIGDTTDPFPVIVYGLHWQHRFGDYAKVGTTFLNQLMSSPGSKRSDSWRGDLSYEMVGPKTIRVFVADDSPKEENASALVFGVDIEVTGMVNDEKVKLTSVRNVPGYDSRLEPISVEGGTITASGAREATGSVPIVYEFAIPSDVTVHSARFGVDVAGDFRIGVRQIHGLYYTDRKGALQMKDTEWPASFVPSEAVGRDPHKWYIQEGEEPYFTLYRSEGRESSRNTIWVDHGMPTGQRLASIDWTAKLAGLDLSGEISRNNQSFMYPIGNNEGKRSASESVAYWLNIKKTLIRGLYLGAEIYRMDPEYSGGYDSYRGGLSFHMDRQTGPNKTKSQTQEYSLVEDNDDDDMWPDESMNEVPVFGVVFPGWPNSSVYPGLDQNSDNMADIDRNENFIADWEEAFVMYDADPPDYVYGIDFNNNGYPDFRENDDLPDYPYKRDHIGKHLVLQNELLGPLGRSLSIGGYKVREVAGGGRSEALYLRYAYEYAKSGTGSINLDVDLKSVKDNIEDHSYVYVIPPDDPNVLPWLNRPTTAPEYDGVLGLRPATPDMLNMRDSRVVNSFLNIDVDFSSRWSIFNTVLFYQNRMAAIEGTTDSDVGQLADTHTRIAVVNKIESTFKLFGWNFRPRFKHRLRHETSDSIPVRTDWSWPLDTEVATRVSTSDFIPVLTAGHELTANSRIMLGVQGLPLLPFKHVDWRHSVNSYDSHDYLIMFNIQREYFGIPDNSIFIGYQKSKKVFPNGSQPRIDRSVLFVELMSPF